MSNYKFPLNPPYRITQKFGQNLLDYSQFGLKGHNGIDVAGVPRGTPILCPFDGQVIELKDDVEAGGKGYGNYLKLKIIDAESIFEFTFGHILPNTGLKINQMVKKGEKLAFVNSTGYSTSDHLHFGVRELNSDGSVKNYDNGYKGSIDPAPFFVGEPDEIYNVDERYGQTRNWSSFLREKWVIGAFTKKVNRLPTHQEIKGLAYGFWDVETILDPAMLYVWRQMTKPEYLKRLGKL